MKFSIMFITYNRKIELLRALVSCVQRRISEMEIVVVDNNSSDGTQFAVEEYLKKEKINYKYYYSETNLGVAEGRNKAFEMCSGEYIICLDDDAVLVTEKFFEKVYKRMKNSSAVAAAVCIYEPLSKRYLKGFTYKKEKDWLALSYIGAAHVLKKSFFEGDYLYPSTFRFGSEEYYVAYKIRKHRKKMLYLDDIVVHHLPSKVARVYGDDRNINIIVNNYVVRKLCYPLITIPILQICLVMRIIKHKYYTFDRINEIREMIKQRYLIKFVNRMNIFSFVDMIKDVGIKQVF